MIPYIRRVTSNKNMICPNLYNIDFVILIPCYNNFDGLINSIRSINYTEEKFFILIIDDGSDEVVKIEQVKQGVSGLVNIEIITHQNNQGITKALNNGLEYIYTNFSAKYIARLDCGDICSPERFYKQIAFFDQQPDVHLTGTWCYFKNALTGEGYSYSTPVEHNKIKQKMYFKNVFVHPTVMWRIAGVGRLKYPEQYPFAEDYGLFYEMISKVKSAIINEFLVTCEINYNGISISNRRQQLKSRLKVIKDNSSNTLLLFMGVIKIYILMITPNRLVFIAKSKLSM